MPPIRGQATRVADVELAIELRLDTLAEGGGENSEDLLGGRLFMASIVNIEIGLSHQRSSTQKPGCVFHMNPVSQFMPSPEELVHAALELAERVPQ